MSVLLNLRALESPAEFVKVQASGPTRETPLHGCGVELGTRVLEKLSQVTPTWDQGLRAGGAQDTP